MRTMMKRIVIVIMPILAAISMILSIIMTHCGLKSLTSPPTVLCLSCGRLRFPLALSLLSSSARMNFPRGEVPARPEVPCLCEPIPLAPLCLPITYPHLMWRGLRK
jgi:hypothetical protein